MAQAGLFVPCEKFEYYPYKNIFSRILGNDNLFKGLSTFAVEMSELRHILRYTDENSLILGDELCSGTEIESAISKPADEVHHLAYQCNANENGYIDEEMLKTILQIYVIFVMTVIECYMKIKNYTEKKQVEKAIDFM